MTAVALASLLAIQLVASPAPAAGGLPDPGPAPAEQVWPGADAYLERLATQTEASAQARSPWTLARLHRLWNFANLHPSVGPLDRALATVAEAPGLPPLVRDHARFLQGERQLQRGKIDEARAVRASLGFVTSGLLVGPFDNSAGGGHGTEYAPEQSTSPDIEMVGPHGPLRWRSFDGLAPDGIIELSSLSFPGSEGTAYVAVAIVADRATKVALRLGSTDAVSAFLNGARVVDHDTRRFAALDQESIGVRLSAGDNILLVKSSWSEGTGRLMIRITAPEGGPAAGIQISGEPETVRRAWRAGLRPRGSKAQTFSGRTVTSGLDGASRRSSATSPADRAALKADLLAVLGLYDRRKVPSVPETLLADAIRLEPNDPELRFFLAHRARGRDPSLARTQLEAALVSDPGYVPAGLALGDIAKDAGRVLEARERLDDALRRDPGMTRLHASRAQLGFDLLDEGAVALARLTSAPSARSSAGLLLESARMKRALGDLAGARKDAEAALELRADDDLARSILVDVALDAGDIEGAIRRLRRAVRQRPHALAARLHLARILAGAAQRSSEAHDVLQQATLAFPQHPTVPVLAAELLLFEDKLDAGLAALERALTLDPHQPSVRRHRRALSGEEQEIEDRYSLDPQVLAKMPVSDDERRFGAAVLADRKVVRLYENDKSALFQQTVFRLVNPRLEDALRGHRIFYAPSRETVEVLSAERIRPNGEIVAAERILDEGPRGKVSGMYVDQRFKLVVFDALEAGDVVHLRYRRDSLGPNIFGGFFGDVTPMQGALPKYNVFYRAITPKGRTLYPAMIRVGEPVVSEGDEGRMWTWSLPEVSPLDIEPLAPPYPQIGSLVSVTTYANWDELGRWYGRLFAEQMELDDDARRAGRAVIRGAKDDAEKVRRLYDYVVKNTRYVGIELGIHGWKPFPASEVHRRRYGDCKDKATLLSALLRDNGVEATITLVRTADRGHLPPDHATMWAFNHAITYVPKLDLFLDPTAEFNGSTELPYPDQGATALVVFPDGRTRLTTLPVSAPADNLNASRYVATLDRTTKLVLEGEERFRGARAAELRREMDEEDKRVRHLEEPLAQIFPGVKVQEATFSNLTDLEAEVSYRYRFVVPRYGRQQGRTLSVPVALYRHQVASAYAQLTKRSYAVHLSHAWKTQNVIRYRLPAGAQVDLPPGVTIDGRHIALIQRVTKTDDGFETDDTVILKSRIVPAEDYPEFREACLAIDRAMARKVVIQW